MLPSRSTARLAGHDYSAPGAYFTTICARNRGLIFGSVAKGSSNRSALGHLAADHLLRLPSYYSNLVLDEWIVMPNHIHAILMIRSPLPETDKRPADSLDSIVSCYKAGVTREAKQLRIISGSELIWQPRYHDHVLRHERALERVREYIKNNPLQWELDRENPGKSGDNEFYAWMEAYTKKTASTR